MLYRLTQALLVPFIGHPDAQVAAFWLQHYAHRPLTASELSRRFWRW